MAVETRAKDLLKILIGAAWIDGSIQIEERQYLRQLAQEQGLAEDPELKPYLYELVQVKPEQCHRWIEDYLGKHPDLERCSSLLEAIAGLVYSDNNIEVEEAKLLSHIQAIETTCSVEKPSAKAILATIQNFYRTWSQRLSEG
ncbi:MAG: TerB family tellurite resistance protein [Synechococcales cyanobacterium RM1_1_8]|nr:TerB family tellurite resistance protein [Synechococcales cyanobacterium RM1_1_8]